MATCWASQDTTSGKYGYHQLEDKRCIGTGRSKIHNMYCKLQQASQSQPDCKAAPRYSKSPKFPSMYPLIYNGIITQKASTTNFPSPYSNPSSNSDDPESRVCRPLQTEITNKEKDECDCNKQTSATSNVERSGIVGLYNTVTLGISLGQIWWQVRYSRMHSTDHHLIYIRLAVLRIRSGS